MRSSCRSVCSLLLMDSKLPPRVGRAWRPIRRVGSVVGGAVGPESFPVSHGQKNLFPSVGITLIITKLKNHLINFLSFKEFRQTKTFETVSPFLVQRAIVSTIGEVNFVRKLRSGDLLVEVNSLKQAQQILKLKSFETIQINVTTHRTLNSCEGVITCGELFNDTMEQITQELKSEGVIHVRRINIRRDGKLVPTKHLILTFNSPKLPESIRAGYIKLPVKPFIPNPLRCFKCQRFGHSQSTCRGTLTCARCAVAGHESTGCTSDEKCANCKGGHTSFSRSCPKWKLEKEIVTTKVKKGISFPEARRLVQAQTPTEGKSYASALKTPLATSMTQTKRVILTTDTDSDPISNSPIAERSTKKFKKKRMPKAQQSLALKFSKQGCHLKDLKSKRSVALDLGKAGLATRDLTSLFGNPSSSELLEIHPSEDDVQDFQMSCELPATQLTGVINSPPSAS
ncbi:hypothetical protein AVEN_100347-1 [Araneus ventricosus]|uniref:CCHC-type domain-containing protein n=1 Tax=Araneus ventricosus TaxID=182803 RepID=A0A4Y2P5A3_ARAVE|nr:hypothetical protein AVEN_100347-1 [Araneus ventricosus]